MGLNVVIVGASNNPERYSHKAMLMLEEYGHKVYLVHPNLTEIEGRKVYAHLAEIKDKIHTVTLYIAPAHQAAIKAEVIKLRPKRVIFNPGTENHEFQEILGEKNILAEEACTLVLLRANLF